MDYKESLKFLFTSLPMYQRLGAAAYKNDLSTTKEIDKRHGHPHRNFKSIHIAGTNGKGSVSHMLASVLQSAGYKTGLYTSPHLKDFRERIRINGEMIPEEEVVSYLQNNRKMIDELKPSFFEMTVDMAFLYFSSMEVDYAVIETGMGGRLDSTNIITPEISVITNIGLDHTRFLGETHARIAQEKAGIIKEGVTVVIGERHPESLPVFMRAAREKNAPIFVAEERFTALLSMMQKDRSINLTLKDRKTGGEVVINTDLAGNYQHKNIVTLLQTLEVLGEKGLMISKEEVLQGLRNVKRNTGLRGRWEEIAYNPLIVCDTAHNAEGISLVMDQIKNVSFRKLHIIWGMVSDKNPGKILKLLPKDAFYYFTKADIPRSMDETMLYEMAKEHDLEGRTYLRSGEALRAAQDNAQPEDLIFIGGSTFLVGELLED